MGLGGFFIELRRRRVFRAAALYVVGAWVAVQVISLILPAFEIPDSALRYVWLVALLLFPLAVVFAWSYDLSAAGITRTAPASDVERFDPSLRRTDYLILGALGLVAIAITLQMSFQVVLVDAPAQSARPYSVAVLPFDNLSGNLDEQYFTSGMQASLIASLSRVKRLRVISRSSTMQYRDDPEQLPAIARQLGVANIVAAQVLRNDDRVSIAVQLLDAERDEHLWSATFDDDLENILTLQNRIAVEIAGQIGVTLDDADRGRLGEEEPVNTAAYEAFLKGEFHVERYNPEDMQLAAGYFQQAVDIDPDYALGHWGLAKLCAFKAQAGVLTPDEARPLCLPLTLRALELDPLLPEAQMGYGATLTWQHFDFENARDKFERAIELNPSYAEAHMFYSHYLGIMGELDKSTEHMALALELDPMNAFVKGLHSIQLIMREDYEQALLAAEAALSSRGAAFGYLTIHHANHELGNEDASAEGFALVLENVAGQPEAAAMFRQMYAELGYSAAMLAFAQQMEQMSAVMHVPPIVIGGLYDHGGDVETAIRWYRIAVESGDPDAPYLGVNVKDPAVQAHPDFIALLREIGLDYWADEYARRHSVEET